MTTAEVIRVGLVGAGPWAQRFHAPMLAAGPATTLTGVWARRPEAARALAQEHGARSTTDLNELLEGCDAVAFAVPPDVQADLAPRAAAAGKHLLLDKPLGFTVEQARRVAEATAQHGVVSMIVLTNRFTEEGRSAIERVRAARERGEDLLGAQARYISGAARAGEPFATPWRVARGALPDVGPHVFDLLIAMLGEVTDVAAQGDSCRIMHVTTEHDSGAVAQTVLSVTTPGDHGAARVEVYASGGAIAFDAALARQEEGIQRRITDEFAAAVASGHHQLDAAHGLRLQQVLARIEDALAG